MEVVKVSKNNPVAWLIVLCALVLMGAHPAQAQVPGDCELPVAQRTRLEGCYLLASTALETLPRGPLYWHLYNYPTRIAAEGIVGQHTTIVESFGRIWLMAIAPRTWQPTTGRRVAVIGPLPVDSKRRFTARYMEAVSTHGMESRIHRHPGPEAWYVLNGRQCLETPEGHSTVRAGHGAIVRGGPPLLLGTVGDSTRRALVLVLHPSGQSWVEMVTDWKPKHLCP
jgi:quercetin dioxygenase-like cupin family protein